MEVEPSGASGSADGPGVIHLLETLKREQHACLRDGRSADIRDASMIQNVMLDILQSWVQRVCFGASGVEGGWVSPPRGCAAARLPRHGCEIAGTDHRHPDVMEHLAQHEIGCNSHHRAPWETEGLQLVEYEPVICKGRDCGAVLNPFCYVDFHSKSWTCPFCHQRNRFPQHYADHITETNLPAELLQMCSTIEYIIPQVVCQPPVFLLVLDIALIEEELDQAKELDSLQQSLAMMPQNALVGFITFGAMCYVHELASTTLPKAYAFRGGKEYTAQQVAYQLGFALKNDPRGTMGAQAARRFLLPVAECEFTLNSLLDDLSRDAWPPGGHDRRPFRCTGAALSVALGLVEATCPQRSAGSVAMALHLLRRVTHAGMDELANWTAKTYKFSFHNDSSGAVRILVEEDPDGMAELEEWKLGDGIPTVGKAGERHRQKLVALKKSINASKPYQEFTVIRDQTKTINMRSPVIKCRALAARLRPMIYQGLALAEWNGALKIMEIQRRLTEGNTFTVHRGYDRSPGMATVRAGCLEHALLAAGVQLGFVLDEAEGTAAAAVPAAPVPRAGTGGPGGPGAGAKLSQRAVPSEPPPLPPPATAPFPLPQSAAPHPAAPAAAPARPPAPRPRPTSASTGSRVRWGQVHQVQQASPAEPDPAAGSKAGLQGFLPMTGQIRLLHGEEWIPAHFVGLSLGGLAAAVAGAVCVEYADRASGAMTQQVRVSLLVGGPCNVGPGMVVGEELAETIRSHLDLQKETPNAKYTKKALKFYASLASRAVACGFAVDIFACSLDQVGLYEMKVISDKTGGFMVMSDSFSMHVFKDSFRKVFEPDETGYLKLGFNAKIEVFTSREFKCCGAVGGLSLGKKGPCVAETEIGEGNTCQWVVGSLDRNTTIGFYFDIANQQANSVPQGKQAFLQFQTCYLHPSGRKRLRVTTVSHRFSDAQMTDIQPGFDQEAAAVLMARYADPLDVLRWVDRMLIRLVSKFANFRKALVGAGHRLCWAMEMVKSFFAPALRLKPSPFFIASGSEQNCCSLRPRIERWIAGKVGWRFLKDIASRWIHGIPSI
eukprot:s4292_g1.t1